MNSKNLTTLEKEVYQQPELKVITIQTSRSILNTSDPTWSENGSFDNIE